MKNTQKWDGGTQKRIRHKINHFKVKTKMEGTQESPYTTECFKRNKQWK